MGSEAAGIKAIFLDIDGVMNSAYGKGPFEADMEVGKLALLKKLIEVSGASGIILISDRRYSPSYMKEFLPALEAHKIPYLSKTRNPKKPKEGFDNRGLQIRDFLYGHEEIKGMAILDDIDDGISGLFPKEFIKVDRYLGLDEGICEKALKALGR